MLTTMGASTASASGTKRFREQQQARQHLGGRQQRHEVAAGDQRADEGVGLRRGGGLGR